MRVSTGVVALLSLPILAAAEVTVEFWTSPRFDWNQEKGLEDGPNVKALKILKMAEIGFGNNVTFDMNQYINSGKGICPTVDENGSPLSEEAKLQVCQDNCMNGLRYCEAPPTDTEHADVTGSMIVSEALTRQCIWKLYHSGNNWANEQKFYDYVEQIRERGCDMKTFMERCIQNAWEAIEVEAEQMDQCRGVVSQDSINAVLDEQIQKQAERNIDQLPVLPAILVNGMPVTEISQDAVFLAICVYFPKGSIDVCEGKISEVLGEDENPEDEKQAEEQLVSEIAEELGETKEEVEEEVIGLTENGDLGLSEEEKKTIMEAEEDELEAMEEEEEELGEEAFEALDKQGNEDMPSSSNGPVPVEGGDAGSIESFFQPQGETPTAPTPPLPSESASPQVPNEASPPGEGTEGGETPAVQSPSEVAPQGQEPEGETPAIQIPSEVAPPTESVAEKEGEAATARPQVEFPSETKSPEIPTPNATTARPQVEFPSETKSPEIPIPNEISSPELEKINSVSESTLSELEPEAPPREPASPLETPNIVDEEIDSLDLSIVDTALSHLEALETCNVDTALLMEKLLDFGTSGKLTNRAEDIESDLPLFMTQDCSHDDGVEILHRLRNFNGCAMFDLQALIESFPSTAVGVAMRCAKAYQNMTKEEEEKGYIPYDCIRTIEASSALGRGIFGLYLYPDVACPCFEHLGDEIPQCTADVWPIPINGALLKTQSCLVGEYCKSIDGVCNDKMKKLDKCLPPRGTRPQDMHCGEIFNQCSEVYEDIHPMLNAAPLPDACVRIAQGSDYYGTHIVERYDVFRHQCGENIELWEGHAKLAEFKSFVQEGIYGIDYQSVPFVSGAVGGFLAGVIFTIVFIIVRSICICIKNFICNCLCCGRKNKRPMVKDYATVATDGEIEEYRDEP